MSIINHDEAFRDRAAMLAMRAMIAASGSFSIEPGAREAYDQLIARTKIADDVETVQAEVGGVAGWWVTPAGTRAGDGAILYVHGGGYVLGSAEAYRGLASQIATRAGRPVFVVDYALAPENPFPAAYDDVSKVYVALAEMTGGKVALMGDSAGGGAVLSVAMNRSEETPAPVAIVAYSPWTDPALMGESVQTRADVDPILTEQSLSDGARQYLAGADKSDSRVNALAGDFTRLPPVRIDVGDDEILLDDSLRFESLAGEAGRQVETHVWKGMVHVFPTNVGMLKASGQALDGTAEFLKRHF
ncbi:alpha/beta hydrolase [Stakelama pacifica]|uniref:Acetyl esterase/lipase n=1 Tax=Stakelama pacifica TaxID=517720 RepID=A0A4R6FP35_9SPHN|nr:alpha/beta hydrolase [Stakelama pacifica]TDN82820.1 acetyl esterase/lipase [Stakelama pacifica]GGO95499.1 alpha/beta hydrolase [Stakelama pacifica]